jgi:hypothetical protein
VWSPDRPVGDLCVSAWIQFPVDLEDRGEAGDWRVVAPSGMSSRTVAATEVDDDAIGLSVSATARTIPEGATATFTVALTAAPTASTTVTVSRTAGDADVTVAGGASLTFTTTNWNTAQAVTVLAAQDSDDTNGAATITVAAAGMASRTVSVTEADDDLVAAAVIYGDALASGWTSNSWYASINWGVASPVHDGTRAIGYTATQAWSGLDFSHSGFSTAGHSAFRFAARATQPGQRYSVFAVGPNGHLTAPIPLANYGGDPVAGAWTVYRIPLSDLDAVDAVVTHLCIHEWLGQAQPALYVDGVQLVRESASTPYAGTARTVTTTIQAERFDDGGAGVAYLDAEPANLGGALRATGVDLESTSDAGGGHSVGWIAAGDWMQYTVSFRRRAPMSRACGSPRPRRGAWCGCRSTGSWSARSRWPGPVGGRPGGRSMASRSP